MRHVATKTLEYYVPQVGRKVNLWGLVPTSEEFFEDIQQASLKVAKMCLEAGLEQQRDALIGADRHGRHSPQVPRAPEPLGAKTYNTRDKRPGFIAIALAWPRLLTRPGASRRLRGRR